MIHVLPSPGKAGLKDAVQDAAALHDRFLPLGLNAGTLYVIGNDCRTCQSCVSLRIRTTDYNFSRNEKHILKNNEELRVTTGPVRIDFEHYALFTKYLNQRHPENDNNNWQMQTLKDYFIPHTHMMEMRSAEGKLVAAIIFDLTDTSLSAFQMFYDPAISDNRRSIGTLSYLKMIQFAQDQKRDHIYVGSWVSDSNKLNYKKRFQNLEALTAQGWVKFDPAIHTTGPDPVKNVPAGTPWLTSP